jgi:hypothetical protein
MARGLVTERIFSLVYLKDLLDHASNPEFRKGFGLFTHQSQKVALNVLEDKVESGILPDNLLQFDHIGMVQLFERFHLPKVHYLVPRVIFPFHGLDGNLFTSFHVGRHVH